MPELPEVQTVVSDLNENILDKEIISIEVFWDKILDNIGVGDFKNNMKNEVIKNISRRAKYIVIEFNSGIFLAFHLRMSGQLIYLNSSSSHNYKKHKYKHIRLLICFSDSSKLIFNEMRKFGRAYYFSTSRELQFYLSKRVGKEPFLITDGEFVDIFRKRKGIIKGALLRQDLVCGLGNIYVDESLFKAGIFPTEVCNTISKNKLIELSRAIKEVLKNAINLRGTSMRDYLDITGSAGKYKDILNVYGREGKPCKKCGMKIEKIKVASRGTHVCYECQGRKNRESRF